MAAKDPAMTPQQELLTDTKRSGFAAYKELVVGKAGLSTLVLNEVVQSTSSWIPGLPGLALRAMVYPYLFRRCGKRPAIGKGCTIRGAVHIALGDGVVLDDYTTLDVRGEDASIVIENRVSIGRFTTVAAKGGLIELAGGTNIGSYCRIATNSKVQIGESVLIGAYSYIGPGNHTDGDESDALISNPMDIRGGVSIGEHAWLGARVTVLDGVSIGKHAIIGAHSLVTQDVPEWGVAVGVPARVIKVRK